MKIVMEGSKEAQKELVEVAVLCMEKVCSHLAALYFPLIHLGFPQTHIIIWRNMIGTLWVKYLGANLNSHMNKINKKILGQIL